MKKKFKLVLFSSIVLGCSQIAVLAMDPPEAEPGVFLETPSLPPVKRNLKAGKPDDFLECKGLSSDDIRSNHQRLKESVNQCYKNGETHFNRASLPEKLRATFDFKKGVNLCAVGVQWVIQAEDKQYISDFEVLRDSKGKELISSNTSAYQWENTILDEKNFHILAWPTVGKSNKFHTSDLIKKDTLTPDCFGDILEDPFREVYKESSQKIQSFLDQSFGLIKNINSTHKAFKSLTKEEKEQLKKLERFFKKTKLLFQPKKAKEPTQYFQEKGNPSNNLTLLLNNYNNKKLGQEEINIEEIIPADLLTKDRENYLSRFSYLLGTNNEAYKALTVDDNMISDIRKYYPLDIKSKIDISHSEPLLCWWIGRNIEAMRKEILGRFTKERGSLKVTQSFPIFFFYTERQTCPSCENIVQKMACSQYIPIICFNDNYSPDFILLGGSKFPFQGKDFTPPYSTPPAKYILPFFLLDKLKGIKEPTDLRQESLQVNYNKTFHENFSFIERNQGVSQRKIMAMEENVKSLENIQNSSSSSVQSMNQNKEEDLLYKALLLNEQFQYNLIQGMKQQIEAEKKLVTNSENFVKNQREKLSSEENTLIEFKNHFHRIPIQYKIDYKG